MTSKKNYRGRISTGKRRTLRILKAAVSIQIVLFILLVWIGEIFELSHVFPETAIVPADWIEAAIESVYALAIGVVSYLIISAAIGKSTPDEQERKRQKVISDILMYEAPTLFLAVNPDSSILMASRSLLDKLGYTHEEVVGKDYPSLFVPEREREGAMKTLATIVETGNTARNERHIVSRHGQEYLVQWEGRVAYLENGEIDFLYAAGLDITEQKEAETALKLSEERYRSFVQNFQGIAYQGTLDFVTIFSHGAVEQITGYREQDFLSGSPRWDEIIHPDDVPGFHEGIEQIRSVPSYAHERTYRIIRKDGQVRWVREFIQNICGSTGRPIAVQGIIYDVTSIKQAEESLRKSNERYRLLAENVIDVIWALDKNFRYTYISPSVEKMRGYTVEEAMNLPLDKMFSAGSYNRMMELFAQERAQYEQEGIPERDRSATFEAELLRKDGSRIWVEVTAGYIFDSAGKPSGFVGITRDVTERKRAESELKISREKLRNLHQHSEDVRESERARVAREIHDELGQVLTALKMDLSFLAKKLPPELEALHTKTTLMLKFVDMTIQSVKRITMDLRPGLLDHLGLVAAIEWQADEFQSRTGIRYTLTVDPEDIVISPDRATCIFRIFQETLTNITRHARATEVKVSLIEKDGILELSVCDNGVGISREQIDDPKSFGLMGIKERAYFSGGQASISGEKGTGTTVTVSIPLDQARVLNDTSASC